METLDLTGQPWPTEWAEWLTGPADCGCDGALADSDRHLLLVYPGPADVAGAATLICR